MFTSTVTDTLDTPFGNRSRLLKRLLLALTLDRRDQDMLSHLRNPKCGLSFSFLDGAPLRINQVMVAFVFALGLAVSLPAASALTDALPEQDVMAAAGCSLYFGDYLIDTTSPTPMYLNGGASCDFAEYRELEVAIRRDDPFSDSDVAKSVDSGTAYEYFAGTSTCGNNDSTYFGEVRIDGTEIQTGAATPYGC